MNEIIKNIFLCGKTPDGEDVYTDGNELYRLDGITCYKYYGKVLLKSGVKDWKGIIGTCEV